MPRSFELSPELTPELTAAGAAPLHAPALRWGFTRREWLRLAGLYGAVAVLHLAGWGLFLLYSSRFPSLLGLGVVAYGFGLRHAFDADHIAAVDDTVRLMVQQGRRPLGVGFFFSLGHATIVFLLALGLTFAAAFIGRQLPIWQQMGSAVGAGVSGLFLCLVGLLNLRVLIHLIGVWRGARSTKLGHDHIEDLVAGGWFNRLFGKRLQAFISRSWHMYPLGLLFGLGFDTASEVGLLAMTAGASAGQLPAGAALSLPLLFAAGMTALDTTDGVLMVKAYDWAFINPRRKLNYNLTVTALSVVMALAIGIIELLQVAGRTLGWRGRLAESLAAIDFGTVGFSVVALFALAWLVSVAMANWQKRVAEPRPRLQMHPHTHRGRSHSHRHYD
jgi:high-affinity nickel-transport protein